ncbi:MAG: DUF3786 domain-containing protein [Bacillota bacterium]
MINLEPALHAALARYSAGAPAEMARLSGATFELEGCFALPFLGTAYRLKFPGGEAVPDLGIQARILCLHYLAGVTGADRGATPGPAQTPGPASPNDHLLAFRELPGGDIYNGPFTNRIVKPLVDCFARRPEALCRAAARLGGEQVRLGDFAARVPVFPRFAVTYVLWLGDEEFPANGTVLFDASAKDYLSTEDCIVAAGEGLAKLRALADEDDHHSAGGR